MGNVKRKFLDAGSEGLEGRIGGGKGESKDFYCILVRHVPPFPTSLQALQEFDT